MMFQFSYSASSVKVRADYCAARYSTTVATGIWLEVTETHAKSVIGQCMLEAPTGQKRSLSAVTK